MNTMARFGGKKISPSLLALEPRLMFDGAAVADAASTAAASSSQTSDAPADNASVDFERRAGKLDSLDPSPTKVLSDEVLSSVHGGDIPSRVQQRTIIPEGSITRASLSMTGPTPTQFLVGEVSIEGERASLIGRFARSVMVVLIREWGA